MGRVFTDPDIVRALRAAEKVHPPPSPGSLSKPVSAIAGVFGLMIYNHQAQIEVDDPELCALIEEFLV